MAGIDGSTLDRLYAGVASRRGGDPTTSHSAKPFARGPAQIRPKLGEAAMETVIEGTRGNAAGIIGESADLLYHLLVLWAQAGIAPAQVWRALDDRAGKSGIDEKKSRPAG